MIPGRRLAPVNPYGADSDQVTGARVSPAPHGRPHILGPAGYRTRPTSSDHRAGHKS
ncbi:hypothetical protein ACE1SV_77300 [Streptomyces sennicomposti]